ncbi:MAG: hypothetical protein ACT4SY_02805 [Hyphomicrobiales bacterium]
MAVFNRDVGGVNSVEVYGQRFSAARTKVGSPILLNQMRPGAQLALPPAKLPNGNYALSWWDTPAFESEGRVFMPNGVPVTGDKLLAFDTEFDEPIDFIGTHIAYRKFPSFFGPTTFRVQRLDANLNRVGSPITLDSALGFKYQSTRIVRAPDGKFIVVWVDTNASGKLIVRGRSYSPQGILVDSFLVADGLNLFNPELAELRVAPIGYAGKLATSGAANKIVLLQNEKRNVGGVDRYYIQASIIDASTGLRTAGPVRISAIHTVDAWPGSVVQLSNDGAGNYKFLATYTGGVSGMNRAFYRQFRASLSP